MQMNILESDIFLQKYQYVMPFVLRYKLNIHFIKVRFLYKTYLYNSKTYTMEDLDIKCRLSAH